MNYLENIREAFKSIKENTLRSALTAAIIAIGITALVGSITAIEALKVSLDSSFTNLGAKNFEISQVALYGRRRGAKTIFYRSLEYNELEIFRKNFRHSDKMSLFTTVTNVTEAKRLSYKTNPNISVIGTDDFYFESKGFLLEKGRNFSAFELQKGVSVAIIGSEVAEKLFPNENPIGLTFQTQDTKFLVVGVLADSKGFDRGSTERSIFIPLACARQLARGREFSYQLIVSVASIEKMDYIIGEARGLMRKIRRDKPESPDSFGIERSDSAEDQLNGLIVQLRVGSVLVSFLTLLGASIGLMNIMLVSVTERFREIGVRKALGATMFVIKMQFLIEAILICLMGGLVGIVMGIGLGNAINGLFENKNFIFPLSSVIVGLVVCVLVGLASGYLPAQKAAKLDPIESLRYE